MYLLEIGVGGYDNPDYGGIHSGGGKSIFIAGKFMVLTSMINQISMKIELKDFKVIKIIQIFWIRS